MRINRYIARATGCSRRKADELIMSGSVEVNGKQASLGLEVNEADTIKVNGRQIFLTENTYLLLNKPTGYVTSRKQQGRAPTIYELLPEKYHGLKPVGRLDKDSRGLLLLTNDGKLAQKMTHPSHQKTKVYHVKLHRQFTKKDLSRANKGVELKDGVSRMEVAPLKESDSYRVRMQEGRNRQIRRTFSSLGYEVIDLQRVRFGEIKLGNLKEGHYIEIKLSTFT